MEITKELIEEAKKDRKEASKPILTENESKIAELLLKYYRQGEDGLRYRFDRKSAIEYMSLLNKSPLLASLLTMDTINQIEQVKELEFIMIYFNN